MISILVLGILFGLLVYGMGGALIRDCLAMYKAPKGRKIEAYFGSRQKGIFWP